MSVNYSTGLYYGAVFARREESREVTKFNEDTGKPYKKVIKAKFWYCGHTKLTSKQGEHLDHLRDYDYLYTDGMYNDYYILGERLSSVGEDVHISRVSLDPIVLPPEIGGFLEKVGVIPDYYLMQYAG